MLITIRGVIYIFSTFAALVIIENIGLINLLTVPTTITTK